MPKAVYSIQEIAELTGFHPETIRRAVRKGEMNAATAGPGSPYRISRDELQRWWTEERGGDPLPLED